MKAARVFFVNRYFHPDESATSQLLSDLAFGLAKSDIDVHVVCSRQLYGAPKANLPASDEIRGVVVHRLWTTRFGRRNLLGRAVDYASFYVTCALALIRRLKRGDIVVAKTDPPLISLVVAVAARWKGAILVNWLQDVFPEVASAIGASPLPAVLDRGLRSWRDSSLRSAAVNVVIGRRMHDYLRGRGIPAHRLRIAENWAVTHAPDPKPTACSELRRAVGLSDKFVVGYSGNLGRAHEYRVFLEAAEALRLESNFQFLFIGGGVGMTALGAEAKDRQLASMHFLPYQPRDTLDDSLAAPDVHLVSLLPSLEGFIVPSKFYGVLAAGRPVVFVGDLCGELAGVIHESGCGAVVRSGDAQHLVDTLRELQRDVVRRDAMAAAASTLLTERYGSSRALANWIGLVIELQGAAARIARQTV